MDDYYDEPLPMRRSVRRRERGPRPGVSAVLSVIIPGLGQVYNGQLGAGLVWFLLATFGYWAVLVPGFLFHVLSVYTAYHSAKEWRGYY